MTRARILIVDDTPANLALLADALEPEGYEILAAADGASALNIARRAGPDVILLDVMMPGLGGLEVCRELKRDAALSETPVVFITARTDGETLVRGFQAGAVDYLVKPFRPEEVVARVATHLRLHRLQRELRARNEDLEAEIARRRDAEQARDTATAQLSSVAAREQARWGLAAFIGESRRLRGVVAEIERLRRFGNTSVLITGESGTGKELVARAIHLSSPRASGPFVPVNCVAIPKDLSESLFFGHVKGSFTGAQSDRKGHFELADGGTLFLDEIGDMPPPLQAKLLRVLEDGEIAPVGASQSRRVNVRVVAATNARLQEKIAGGEFREDLYFRLARYRIETPPLRDRPEDVPLLATHFLDLFAAEMGMTSPAVTDEALAALQSHPFPGNVRELKNCIERALILSGGEEIRSRHLQLVSLTAPRPSRLLPEETMQKLPLNLQAAEQALIQRALHQSGGNVVEAARLLGVNRSRIYRRFPRNPVVET
jgi:DNA-binding NtrC family response regulator